GADRRAQVPVAKLGAALQELAKAGAGGNVLRLRKLLQTRPVLGPGRQLERAWLVVDQAPVPVDRLADTLAAGLGGTGQIVERGRIPLELHAHIVAAVARGH